MSIYIRRLHEGLLLDYAKHFPVTVVAGARQVGKSRLLSEVFGPDVAHVVFDPVQDIEHARIDPDTKHSLPQKVRETTNFHSQFSPSNSLR